MINGFIYNGEINGEDFPFSNQIIFYYMSIYAYKNDTPNRITCQHREDFTLYRAWPTFFRKL